MNLFSDDTFRILRAPNSTDQNTYVRFQSIKYPTAFIRNKGSILWLDNDDGSNTFVSDTTFLIRSGFGHLPQLIKTTSDELTRLDSPGKLSF